MLFIVIRILTSKQGWIQSSVNIFDNVGYCILASTFACQLTFRLSVSICLMRICQQVCVFICPLLLYWHPLIEGKAIASSATLTTSCSTIRVTLVQIATLDVFHVFDEERGESLIVEVSDTGLKSLAAVLWPASCFSQSIVDFLLCVFLRISFDFESF